MKATVRSKTAWQKFKEARGLNEIHNHIKFARDVFCIAYELGFKEGMDSGIRNEARRTEKILDDIQLSDPMGGKF